MFFRFKNISKTEANSHNRPFKNFFLLLIIVVTVWGFWLNSERQLKNINAKSSVFDEYDILSEEEINSLKSMAFEFRQKFGVKVEIRLIGKPYLEDTEKPTIYIGINPKKNYILVDFPPLLRQVLGKDFIADLKTHLSNSTEKQEVYQGLEDVLVITLKKLFSIEQAN